MEVGIELLVDRIDRFEAVPLEHLLHRVARHRQSLVQVLQVHIVVGHLGFGHRLRGVPKNVGHLEQVLAEALNAVPLGILDLLVEARAQILGFGQRAFVFVLVGRNGCCELQSTRLRPTIPDI